MLQFYNTLTRKKEVFKPINKNQVGIYTCGPTVYWYQHIGNLRTYIFSDILKRVLIYDNFKVKHVMNYTDVGHLTSDADTGEDKIEKAAEKEHKTAKEISNYYASVFEKDSKKLNIIPPNITCKASEHIQEQINLIKKLEEKGYTYKTGDGIYDDTSKFKDYGKLAKLKKEGLEAGKRIALKEKRNITDFALWKFSEIPGKRQQEWNPKDFGANYQIGFPGWHLECSAMSMKYLGEHFDIHTGGIDHIPIHHTNEIAQSEAATGEKFVNYWLHGDFLTFKGEKVSKSKGGLYTISELEELNFNAVDFRYLCLNTHYRKRLNFSLDILKNAKNSYERLKNIIFDLKRKKDSNKTKKYNEYKTKFQNYINDDLNMPKALSVLWEMLRDKILGSKEKLRLAYEFDKVFGLDLNKIKQEEISLDIKKLIKERERARNKKDFKKADEIRNKLQKMGIILEDTPKGVVVKNE